MGEGEIPGCGNRLEPGIAVKGKLVKLEVMPFWMKLTIDVVTIPSKSGLSSL